MDDQLTYKPSLYKSYRFEIEHGDPEFAEFPRPEFERRWGRLQLLMGLQGISALVATIEPHYRYLTGHDNKRWPMTIRPRAVILPLEGEPIILTIGPEAFGIGQLTWVREVRVFQGDRFDDGYGRHLARCIVETLNELGVNSVHHRVGIERGWNMQVGLSVDDFLYLERALGPVELVDSAPLWWEQQKVRSPLEIDCIRKACAATSQAFAEIPAYIKAGITERELEKRFNILQLEFGADKTTYTPVNFHRGRIPQEKHLHYGVATDKKLEPGMVIDMDMGCAVKGYRADFARSFAFGEPPPLAQTAHRVMWDAVEAGLQAVKPGKPLSDVAKAMITVFAAAGYIDTRQSTGVLGHGAGVYPVCRPFLNLRDHSPMVEGMFFTLEPVVIVPGYGYVWAEENIVVTADGLELLSKRGPRELPILPT